MRIASGAPALALLLYLILYAQPWALALLALVVSLGGMAEYDRMMAKGAEISIPRIPFYAGGVVVWLGGAYPKEWNLLFGLMLGGVLLVTVAVLRRGERGGPVALPTVGYGLLGLFWIPFSLAHLPLLVSMGGGRKALLMLVLVVVFNDSLAYFTGRFLGRHKLSPLVSPGKTLEGSFGGLLGGALGAALGIWWLGDGPWSPYIWVGILFGVVLAALAQVGDLLESLVKRFCGVKDSGVFLPGHGGLLDRLDAFLLTIPLLYYFFFGLSRL